MVRTMRGAVLIMAMAAAAGAVAHPALSSLVQHEITLEAGAKYVDITVRLTFFGHEATHLRGGLDRDGSGTISVEEWKTSRKRFLHMAERQFTMRTGAESLALLPRFDPEIEAKASGQAGLEQVTLTIHLFTRRPEAKSGETVLILEDGLVPDAPAMAAFHVVGRDGLRVVAEGAGRNRTRAAGQATPLTLTATVYAASSPNNQGASP